MIRIGILGVIGSGKSYVARNFGHPVFDADVEVSRLYKKNRRIFKKLNKKLPKNITRFPIDKKEITEAILSNKKNLKKIISVVHQEIKKKLKLFLKRNKDERIVVLDIPLFLENKINKKDDLLIFVDAEKKKIEKRLKKRSNFNSKLYYKFIKNQIPKNYKKKNHTI